MSNNTFIRLHTGGTYDYVSPSVDSINIRDIAHSLSNICRYAGHVPQFYSVAEHCVRVAEWLAKDGKSRMIQLKGLLHDASEAYCVDIPSPLKHMPEIESGYTYHEQRAQETIAKALGLSMPLEDPEVMAIDRAILEPEQRWRRGMRPGSFGWSPRFAEKRYLELYYFLRGEIIYEQQSRS